MLDLINRWLYSGAEWVGVALHDYDLGRRELGASRYETSDELDRITNPIRLSSPILILSRQFYILLLLRLLMLLKTL